MALILDGTSPTGAWSMFRDLLTSFVGGARYTTAGSEVNLLTEQTGSPRNFANSATGQRPVVATAGPGARACADFDGVNDFLTGSTIALSGFLSAASGYIVVSFIVDAFTTSAVNIYDNSPIFADVGGFVGLHLKSPNILAAYNWGGSANSTTTTIATGAPYVVEWRHDSGSLFLRVNGGAETSVASGNTTTLNALVNLGGVTACANIKIFELATYSTVPALATRNAIVADFMAQQAVAAGAAQARVMVLA
jgi:hypothetical protein